LKKLVSAKLAGNILLVSLGLLLVFHVLVLLNVVPPDMIWGGGANSGNLIILEMAAITITLVFGLVISAKLGYVSAGKFARAVNILVWLVFAFLLLNTLGNLASGASAENFIFAPITLILAFCAFRLAVEK
jgi:hypothetical protein